ncbi:lipocalin family protein [Shewanella aegiceratis]|uniref:lipocalin family protein n=1 Tax=Shewanella aegiceratis TaxID=2864203 RepID=UPI001C6572C2|nr:lipocalin family protein [Shewanella aegiceratis]QYJ81751.1 lipocalin family protein [Shewanella aegiceratis]
MRWPVTFCLVCLLTLLTACTSAPKGIAPIEGFELSRYLGTWHEIARLDHSFERGLSQVTAEYQLRGDGGVSVTNRGFDVQSQSWKSAEGKAYFVESSDIGHLKVSFFGPFYGAYVIYRLDADYQYAFITSYNRDYLWLLARSPEVDESVRQAFITQAEKLGFDTQALIWQ